MTAPPDKTHIVPQTNKTIKKNIHTHISYYYEIRGGGIYIRAGGTAVITGCLFTVNPVLITEFLLTSSPETTVRMCVRACLPACVRACVRAFASSERVCSVRPGGDVRSARPSIHVRIHSHQPDLPSP